MTEPSPPHPPRRIMPSLLATVLVALVGWVMYAQGCRDPATSADRRAAAPPDGNAAAATADAGAACTAGQPCADARPAPTALDTENSAASDMDGYLHRLAQRLALERDGRSQALAWLLLRHRQQRDPAAVASEDPAVAEREREAMKELRRNAVLLSPADGLVAAWLSSGLPEGAEREAAIVHWAQVESWNLAARFVAQPATPPHAGAAGKTDLAAADALLLRSLEGVTGYDTKYNATRYAVIDAVRRYPPTPAELRTMGLPADAVDALGVVLGFALWSGAVDVRLQTLMRACSRQSPTRAPADRPGCARLAAALARSDNQMGEMLGLVLARHAAISANDREAMAAIQQRRNRMDWVRRQYAALQAPPTSASEDDVIQALGGPEVVARDVAALMEGGAQRIPYSEIDLMRAVIVAAGKPAEPPPDWRSDYRFPDEGGARKPGQR